MTPWAKAPFDERIKTFSRRSLRITVCRTASRATGLLAAVQTASSRRPGMIVVLHEIKTMFRQIYLTDARWNRTLHPRGWGTRPANGKATSRLSGPPDSTTRPGLMTAATRTRNLCRH
jgi:hypothetical protein